MLKADAQEPTLLHKLDLLLRTGKLLVESAADTSRVLRNMKRTAAFLGLPEAHLHIYVNYNMLMVNLSDGEHSFTKFQRCDRHGINLEALSAISHLSWQAIRASLIILFIAVGVAIPNIFFRRMIEPKRERELLSRLIERRRQQGKFIDLGHL